MANGNKFYVYVIFRPNGEPCYVGKGHGRRMDKHEWRAQNPHLGAIIKSAGGSLPKVKVRDGLSETDALDVEVALIAAIGREQDGGPLVNLTDGGDGTSGRRWSDAEKAIWSVRLKVSPPFKGKHHSERSRKLLAESHIGLKATEATKAKMRAAHATRKPIGDDVRRKISEALMGEKHPMFGRKHREESKARIRAARKGVPKSPETRAFMSAAMVKRWAEKRALADA